MGQDGKSGTLAKQNELRRDDKGNTGTHKPVNTGNQEQRRQMHAFLATEGTMFNYNTDFKGNIAIWRKNTEVEIPASDLLEFVAQAYVVAKKIERVEAMSTEQLLEHLA